MYPLGYVIVSTHIHIEIRDVKVKQHKQQCATASIKTASGTVFVAGNKLKPVELIPFSFFNDGSL